MFGLGRGLWSSPSKPPSKKNNHPTTSATKIEYDLNDVTINNKNFIVNNKYTKPIVIDNKTEFLKLTYLGKVKETYYFKTYDEEINAKYDYTAGELSDIEPITNSIGGNKTKKNKRIKKNKRKKNKSKKK